MFWRFVQKQMEEKKSFVLRLLGYVLTSIALADMQAELTFRADSQMVSGTSRGKL